MPSLLLYFKDLLKQQTREGEVITELDGLQQAFPACTMYIRYSTYEVAIRTERT